MEALLRALGQRIRELRAARGWSQEEFADVCGVHRTYVGHLERGEKNVSFGTLVRVSEALSVSLGELLAGIEDRVDAPAHRKQPARAIVESQRNKRLTVRDLGAVLDELRLQREAMERVVEKLIRRTAVRRKRKS